MKEITIGRAKDCTIVIDDLKVSSHHARCFETSGCYFIADTKSTNGILVDGAKILEDTEITSQSDIVIAGHHFSGADLISRLQVDSHPENAQPEKLLTKYQELETRYQNNVRMLTEAAKVESFAYVKTFETKDEELAYMVSEYSCKMEESISMLKLISNSSRHDAIAFREDMSHISAATTNSMEVSQRLYDLMDRLQHSVNHTIKDAFEKLNTHYCTFFSKFLESTPSSSKVWSSIKNEQIVSLSSILYGSRAFELPLFDGSISVEQLLFVPFLKQQNLVIRYSSEQRMTAQSVVNSVLGRLLSSSKSGNVHLHMVDVKDLGGTSNMLKMLDKHVYNIYSRPSDFQNCLSALDRHVEDVVQNLLMGTVTSLNDYNRGKENQEPYHIVVIKDFPYGVTQETAYLINRIIVNGVKTGVHFIFMMNDDLLQSEEGIKIARIMHLDNSAALSASVLNLNDQSTDYRIKTVYDVLDDDTLYHIVQRVNAGFEVKNDEVLKLTDYMLPKAEWWSKRSDSLADIPFGISTNKQIQKLLISQESGQNSAVVIGIPGSGKSVFLHVLIASAMVNYSPKELQMYLLDFSGVEFDVYARHKLPHARVIAPEAEREFGLSILREVFDEGNRRMALCRENGVTNIVELKRKNPDVVVPRLLVIIDEFQKIFEVENDKISQEANVKIHAIIQEYRKFGINLILATQKLPAKSIIPYDLIANRVVFKSDPNDFSNLIKWPHSTPQPRLLTGNCVYNSESGSEYSNVVARSFFINASAELENLLDEVYAYGQVHPEMIDAHELRTFRSDELPEFQDRILSDRHIEHQDAPREIGVYLGESIAIAPCHVYMPLTKDSNNNILIIGGKQHIAKGISYHTMISAIAGHTEKSCNVLEMNFMMEDDPMQGLFSSDMHAAIADFCNLQPVNTAEDVKELLQYIKDEVIDARKNDPSLELSHFFISITEFQRARMFDGTGGRGDMQSECARLLEYILKNGPMVGVFTILQVDNLANLNRLCYNAQSLFNHRVALQMPEQESDKIVGSSAANRLLVLNRPATNYRALYYNHVNNSITKFKPYNHGIKCD